MKFRFLPLSLCFATSAMVVAVSAQVARKPPAKAPAAPSATQAGNVILRGANSVYDDETGIGKLNGNVTVSQTGEEFILYAQELTYNRPKNQAVATGSLRIETRSSTIRGARIFADFNTKIITITGNVTVTTHGKTDGITGNRQDLRADFKSKSSKILCERADWDYEDRQATLTGNIRMTQGANSGTCERILYDEERNIARLVGRVRFTDKENRTFNTPNLTVYVDEGRVVTSGGSLNIPRSNQPNATPRPAKPRILDAPPAPRISNDDLSIFGATPPPIPTPRPEPEEAPVPTPRPEPAESAEEPASQN